MTSRGHLGLSLLRISPEEDAEKGINVLLWCCGSCLASPSLDTIIHSESIPLQYIRNFFSLRSSLMLFPISGQTPLYYFVMKHVLSQSLVHGTINHKGLTSMAYMVLLHLQLDLHVLFVTTYSPNSHPFWSFPLDWCRQCCVSCCSTHITELSISSCPLTKYAQFSL
jgi:hypothetical protein